MSKPSKTFPKILSLCYIGVSLLGLCLLAMLTFNFPTSMTNSPFQKQLTGSLFITVCLVGIMAGVSASRCSRILHFKSLSKKSYKKEKTKSGATTMRFSGHHPTCGKFSAHVLRFKGKTYCAGCTGLVTGAAISLLGSFLYFFTDFHVGETIFIFWLGFVGVASGLLQYNLFKLNRGLVHFFLNVIFVLGVFLLLVGVNGINGNFVIEFYLITLIIYWIITRIALSQLEHKKICETCGLTCSVPF